MDTSCSIRFMKTPVVYSFISIDVPWHIEQEYIRFTCRDGFLNIFLDFYLFSFLRGGGVVSRLSPGLMTFIPIYYPRHKEQDYLWLRGGNWTCFKIVGHFMFQGVRVTPGGSLWPTYHLMRYDTKNMYGLEVRFQLFFFRCLVISSYVNYH